MTTRSPLIPLIASLLIIPIVQSFGEIAILDQDITLVGKQNSGILQKQVTFQNIGKTKIAILGATASCGCMVSQITKRTYVPDERGVVIVEVDTTKAHGQQTKKILISTDDPEKPLIEVPIALNIKPILQILPRRLIWVRDEGLNPKSVEIAVADDEKIRIVGVSSTVTSVFPKLDVSRADEGIYRLDIDPKDVKGDTKALIRLETDSPKLRYDYVTVEVQS